MITIETVAVAVRDGMSESWFSDEKAPGWWANNAALFQWPTCPGNPRNYEPAVAGMFCAYLDRKPPTVDVAEVRGARVPRKWGDCGLCENDPARRPMCRECDGNGRCIDTLGFAVFSGLGVPVTRVQCCYADMLEGLTVRVAADTRGLDPLYAYDDKGALVLVVMPVRL